LWAALGSHFFQIEFPKAETLTSESKKFIADLMPRHPIYIPLLPQQAQDVIGQVHPHTRPARAMLESEGFEFRNFVDIFDGGPAVHAVTSQIRVIRENRLGSVREIVEEVDNGRRMIISNCNLDFRCCLGNVAYDGDQMTIDQVTALRLNLKSRDPLRIVDLKPDPSRNG
jgi:arginine N-succinyltransferase